MMMTDSAPSVELIEWLTDWLVMVEWAIEWMNEKNISLLKILPKWNGQMKNYVVVATTRNNNQSAATNTT